MVSPSFTAGLSAILLLASPALSHTWVEEVQLIGSDGTFSGEPGWVRDHKPRSTPGFNDGIAQHQLIKVSADSPMCRNGQTTQNQADGFPALSASPGDHVALRYAENGHVSLFTTQAGKPAGRGTVYIYGTKDPQPTDKVSEIHKVWNKDGTGGDKRGKLIATRPYDDGQCFQDNKGQVAQERWGKFGITAPTNVKCQTDVQIPADAGSGTYTMYWYWDWPTLNAKGQVVSPESYTSCLDINLSGNKSQATSNVEFAVTATKDNANSIAIPEQLKNQFLVDPTAPLVMATDNPCTNCPAGADQQTPPSESSGGGEPGSAPTNTVGGGESSPTQDPTFAPSGQVGGGGSGSGGGNGGGRGPSSSRRPRPTAPPSAPKPHPPVAPPAAGANPAVTSPPYPKSTFISSAKPVETVTTETTVLTEQATVTVSVYTTPSAAPTKAAAPPAAGASKGTDGGHSHSVPRQQPNPETSTDSEANPTSLSITPFLPTTVKRVVRVRGRAVELEN